MEVLILIFIQFLYLFNIKDFRAQMFARTDFFKTLTAGRK